MTLFLREKPQTFVLASGGFFIASILAAAIPLHLHGASMNRGITQPLEASLGTASANLEEQARDFERLLEREPNNRAALEGLANARIHLGDAQGAIAPLETLVKQFPERVDYQALLQEAKQQTNN